MLLDPAWHMIREAGDWLILAPAGARVHPDIGRLLAAHAAMRPDVGIFYADEVEFAGEPDCRLLLKPALNLTLLLADDYIGTPVMILQSVFERLQGLRAGTGSAAVYDLVLRATGDGVVIERMPLVMVAHPGARPRAALEDRRAAVNHWIGARRRLLEVVQGRTVESLQIRRIFDEFPEVTLVVATRQARPAVADDAAPAGAHVLNLLDSLAATDWPPDRLQVLIGDDVVDDSIYQGRRWPFAVRRILTPRRAGEPFNYAAKMNRLWREAGTEHLVLVNDDIIVREPGWLRALMTFAMDAGVGGVGARLLYADGTIQHAGMPGGLYGATAHAWIRQPGAAPTYGDWAVMHREWSMVTGALFATRRSVLDALNGFDERFSLEFNDADLCLRLRLLGYRIVYTPFAELIHHEQASRGAAPPRGDEVALFLKRWSGYLDRDPAFHPGFDMGTTTITPQATSREWYAG